MTVSAIKNNPFIKSSDRQNHFNQLSIPLSARVFSFLPPEEYIKTVTAVSKSKDWIEKSLAKASAPSSHPWTLPDVLSNYVFLFLTPMEFTETVRLVSKHWLNLSKQDPKALKHQLDVCNFHIEWMKGIGAMDQLASTTADTSVENVNTFFYRSDCSTKVKNRFFFLACASFIPEEIFTVSDEDMTLSGVFLLTLFIFNPERHAQIASGAAKVYRAELVKNKKFSASISQLLFKRRIFESNLQIKSAPKIISTASKEAAQEI